MVWHTSTRRSQKAGLAAEPEGWASRLHVLRTEAVAGGVFASLADVASVPRATIEEAASIAAETTPRQTFENMRGDDEPDFEPIMPDARELAHLLEKSF